MKLVLQFEKFLALRSDFIVEEHLSMVKKDKNKLKIDYEKGIVEGRLRQIRNHTMSSVISLVNVWSFEIQPQNSPQVLGLIRELSIVDPVRLQHVKRLQKMLASSLTVILCSSELIEKDDLVNRLEKNGIVFQELRVRQVPAHCPPTKELALRWGEKHWPLVWKGNPNDQVLNGMVFNMEHIGEHLRSITEESMKCSALPIVTSIVDPTTNSVVACSRDVRHEHPLHHSIMRSIEMVAENELLRRSSPDPAEQHYLCNDYHVYTTHEPCTMCAMALVHSRVARLIYLRRSPKTGALSPESGPAYTINDHGLLNSRFEVFEWLGYEYNAVPELDTCVNA